MKDLRGKDFGSLHLQGNYYLLFFGGTLCPDVCPLTLMKMTKAIRALQRSSEGKQYCKCKAVFVSVNPKTDTPQILKDFSRNLFGNELICLTSSEQQPEQLQNMLRLFKVPVGLTEEES